MLERVESDDAEAAREARAELQALFRECVRRLLHVALKKNDSEAKRWAGVMLAKIYAYIGKYDAEKGKHARKLTKENAAYLQEKKKIGKLRTDVLFSESPMMRTVRRELKKTERNRNDLLLLKEAFKTREKLKKAAMRQRIPEAFLPTLRLPEFWEESRPQWSKFLWPLLRKNNPALLQELRSRAQRVEAVWSFSEGSSKRQFKKRKLFWGAFQTEFDNCLKTLAGQRSARTLAG